MELEKTDAIKKFMKSLKLYSFRIEGSKLIRKRGKCGDEIIDLENLTWYCPTTHHNKEFTIQYDDINRMMNKIYGYLRGYL